MRGSSPMLALGPTVRPTRSRSPTTRQSSHRGTTTPASPTHAARGPVRPPSRTSCRTGGEHQAAARAPHPPARRPGRAVAQLAPPLLRHRRTSTPCRRRLPPGVELAIRDLKESSRASGVLRQRRLAWRARAQPRPLDRPPRPPTPSAAHRRGHHPQPAPHGSTAPPQTAPAAQRHGPPWDTSTAPTHLSRPQRPAQRSRRTSPTLQSRTPKRAGPHTPTASADPTNPSIPKRAVPVLLSSRLGRSEVVASIEDDVAAASGDADHRLPCERLRW